jgi:hypothetical protein
LAAILIALALSAIVAPTAFAGTRWPTRATPLSSTEGWFQAINAHNRKQLLFYVAPSAKDQMGWARPSQSWSKFTHLDCKTLRTSRRTALVRCTFVESSSPTEGNPDSFWDIYLRHSHAGWLIDNYGQG